MTVTPGEAAAALLLGTAVAAVGVPALGPLRCGADAARAVALGAAGLLPGVLLATLAAGAGPALRASAPCVALVAVSWGAAAAVRAAGMPGGGSAALAGLLSMALLALPFLGDPLVEPGGAGRASPGAVRWLLAACPMAGAVGGGLEVDLLRAPRAYGGSGGGLSSIGAYHRYAYPDPLVQAGGCLAVAALLGTTSSLVRRRRRA